MINLSSVLKKAYFSRYFELKVAESSKEGLLPGPVYLSIGQELTSSTLSELTKGYAVFAQHRNHSIYLAHGGDPQSLKDELFGQQRGCCQGKGGSPCVQDLNVPMYGHHGLIGENIPIATGYALATQKPVICYFGDAAAEEDYALASFGFAATQRLPILFICEDNDLSILTRKKERRSWRIDRIAEEMGMFSCACPDEPSDVCRVAEKAIKRLPALLNITTTRFHWHVGANTDGWPKFDRLERFKGTVDNGQEIEDKTKEKVTMMWKGKTNDNQS